MCEADYYSSATIWHPKFAIIGKDNIKGKLSKTSPWGMIQQTWELKNNNLVCLYKDYVKVMSQEHVEIPIKSQHAYTDHLVGWVSRIHILILEWGFIFIFMNRFFHATFNVIKSEDPPEARVAWIYDAVSPSLLQLHPSLCIILELYGISWGVRTDHFLFP